MSTEGIEPTRLEIRDLPSGNWLTGPARLTRYQRNACDDVGYKPEIDDSGNRFRQFSIIKYGEELEAQWIMDPETEWSFKNPESGGLLARTRGSLLGRFISDEDHDHITAKLLIHFRPDFFVPVNPDNGQPILDGPPGPEDPEGESLASSEGSPMPPTNEKDGSTSSPNRRASK